jgi:outer membrane immunogenic protein
MKTKSILTGIVAAMLTAPLAAQAADLPRPNYKAPAYVAPAAPSWTGFYVGFNGGYGFGSSDWDTTPSLSIDVSGGTAGVTLGYNYQTGTWVWGIEGDVNWADISGDTACGAGTCETKTDWLSTLRLRLGYAGWSGWMPYLTGGAAFAGVTATSPLGEGSETMIGWTAGAGFEYAWRSNWSFKFEYLYADLGSFDCAACNVAGTTTDVSFQTSLIRAGINYRF